MYRLALLLLLLTAACGGQATPSSTTLESVVPSPSIMTAGPLPSALTAGLVTVVDEPYTEVIDCGIAECAVPLDILAPSDGEALPTVVMVPGGPVPFEGRRYFETLAAELAREGAVVYVTAYRSSMNGSSDADTAADVRCAVRFARSTTAEHGGDPDRVVLFGHSFGGFLVLQTALEAEAETPGCLGEGSGVPNAVVASAGFEVSLSGAEPSGPPILLMSGSEDDAAATGPSIATRLQEAGYEAEYVEFEGIDHLEVVDPEAVPEVVDLILESAG
jgi:acetyl esterase/lipase